MLPVPMSDEPIEVKLTKWLETQGYPLEMQVASALQVAGFRISQSDYYRDPETRASREIDLVAVQQRVFDDLLFRVTFTVECKTSRDKPWILFTSSRAGLAEPALVVQRAASPLGSTYLAQLVNDHDIAILPSFQIGDRPGYGLTQAFTSGQDVAYAAISTAAKAAFARTRRPPSRRPPSFGICEIAFPTIVIDGRLFEYYLTTEGQRIIAEIPQGTLLWRNPLVGMPHTIIHICTLGGLSSFVDGAKHTAGALLNAADRKGKRVFETWHKEKRLTAFSLPRRRRS